MKSPMKTPMKTMTRAIATLAVLAVCATAQAAGNLTGAWTMNVTGGPHGDATMGLTLQQEGTKVTGSFASGHAPEMAVSGEFVDGALKLATAADNDGDKIIFTAKLKEDGTLDGYISSGMGDMKWTASPAPEKKDKK